VGSNLAGGMIFFLFSILFVHTFFAAKLLAQAFELSKHVSMRDFSKITCPSSGNSNNIAANRYVVLFVPYSVLKDAGVRKTH